MIKNLDQAWFCVGMLNSAAMTEAITPFNPKGAFGERHIHALPYRMMPPFDPCNDDHVQIAALARKAAALAQRMIGQDDSLDDPTRALTSRRRRLRGQLSETSEVREMEVLCAAALGILSAGGG